MALILCIETATEICSVAIVENGNVLSCKENHEGNQHASQLAVLVNEALKSSNKILQNIDAVAVSKGPGSYTGLRVGVSSAKGFCYALDVPLISIHTLEALTNGYAQTFKTSSGLSPLFIPMLDARRMEVYCAVFNERLETIVPAQAKIIDEHSFEDLFTEHKVYFFGNGANKCKATITSPNAIFIDAIACSATHMAHLAQQRFEKKLFEDVAHFEPYYLKDFVGTVAKKQV